MCSTVGCELLAGIESFSVSDAGLDSTSADGIGADETSSDDATTSDGSGSGSSGTSGTSSSGGADTSTSSGTATGSSGGTTSSSGTTEKDATASSGTSSGTSGSSSSGSGSSSSGAALDSGSDANACSTAECTTGCTPLPLIISQYFHPYGYMGDANTAGSVSMVSGTDATTCGGSRSPTALGACYAVTYKPVSATSWAGIYWQYPSSNWGKLPGLPVAKGATKLSFYAKAATTGVVLSVGTGGINTTMAAGDPCYDTFYANNSAVTLTTSWTLYTIPLPASYGPLLGGFVWYATAPGSTATIQFWLDSIEWQ